ncbi:MAG: Type I restriction modification DNA specificity domain protein [Candidatus Nomurabacteria bacterium GW2011_GWA1_37_20]|uniref:Type I restriction modification DNA specificity domain protein n=2 Tax=Parcubacteria group TaxID=1794811 RepID=A0A0G0JW31_9BACT|nr:MAG: Type I restriction modification DNA specificity domain protein [Parcubacteria group bacterium GW2011_GWC1_36_9]KKQ32526.1 MAG: Type I restriction modification DNA specificity domain protein [Candidatus Nomurabacteria bacterium GW2011_GWA1_37_20]
MITYSIIKKSQLESSNRLDAEYYQPEYLEVAEKLKNAPKISELTSDIRYGLYVDPEYKNEGVGFVRATNLLNFWIDEEIFKIDEKNVPIDYRLKIGDSLIVRSGANTGSVGLIYSELENATFGSYTIRLRFNKINPFFASIFLNCKYGVLQTQKLQTGMAQPNLNIPNIKEIKIPIISEDRQKEVENFCIKIEKTNKDSENLYSQAENLLLEELGLRDFDEKAGLWNIVNLSEVKEVGRIDAEYFQPKYEKLISKIKSKNPQTLETFIRTHSTGFPFQSENYQETGIPLIRINNIQKGYLDLSNSAYLSEKDYLLSPKDIAKSGDIVLSMSGSIGMTALVPKDIPKSIINQRILRITPQNIEKDYLVLLLNSIVGSYQLERIGTGGLQTNISYKDIKNILIPVLSKPIQQKISKLIQKSHEARKKAKELLEEAKHKVEELIESK